MYSRNPIKELFYKIRVFLRRNFLPGTEGTFHARTASEASLSVEQVCAFVHNRTDSKGEYKSMVENTNSFLDEAVYLLLNGMTINMGGYFTIYLSIGGTFDNEQETFDPKKHPIKVNLKLLAKLRRMIKEATVSIDGIYNTSCYIASFLDTDEDERNSIFVSGNMFIIEGRKIKLDGDDPNVGVYFVSAADPSNAVKVTRISRNTSTMIIGICPHTGHQQSRLEIRTQYTGATLLKEPRVITSDFTLEEV